MGRDRKIGPAARWPPSASRPSPIEALTDLVYIELPAVGRKVKHGESFGEIESVKAVSDLYSPVDGEVLEVNGALPGHLETLNVDPYGKGWMVEDQDFATKAP